MVDRTICNEIVVLFSKEEIEINGIIKEFLIPNRIVKGHYDEVEGIFIDENDVAYNHVLIGDVGVCFGKRISLAELLEKYPNSPFKEAKKNYLKEVKEKIYFYDDDEEIFTANNIKEITKDGEHITSFKDKDITFYASLYSEEDEFFEETATPKLNIDIPLNILANPKKENKPDTKTNSQPFDVKQLYKELTERVIGQEDAHRKILLTIWKNYTSPADSQAQNIFIKGSTGVGKTETFRIIAKNIGVPITIKDCNDFTINGYKGDDVDTIITDLIKAAGENLEKASRGIVILDEVDKLGSNEGSYDISTSGVQMALLKMLEDKDYMYKGKKFNTKGITFVAMGAFTNMDEKVVKKKSIGFILPEEKTTLTETTNNLTDLEKYGMKPEFLGRFSNYVTMRDLELEDYIRIINSKYSPLQKELKFLHDKGIHLIYDKTTLIEGLAKAAMKLKKGARGVEIVLTNLFSEIEEEIMLNDIASKIEITTETIENPKKYILQK